MEDALCEPLTDAMPWEALKNRWALDRTGALWRVRDWATDNDAGERVFALVEPRGAYGELKAQSELLLLDPVSARWLARAASDEERSLWGRACAERWALRQELGEGGRRSAPAKGL